MSIKNYLSVFLLLATVLQAHAQHIDTIKVKVHGHVITLYASGAGSPAVILEAGGSSNHKTWNKVHQKIAKFTRVISYDRPGYLNSDTCSKQRDAVNIAKELNEALKKAGIQPPYIVAGWSMGGAFVRVFAGLYPKKVVGMVLVDPVPEESYARFDKEFPELMAEDEKYMKEILANKTRIGEREEMRFFDSTINQARRSDKQHSTPTILLIAAGKAVGGQDRDPVNPLNKIWIEELEKWAKKRPNLTYEIIRNSGHHIARDQPDTVVDAIREMVQRYQTKKLQESAKTYKKPDQLNDGILTATLKEVGIDEKIINMMEDSITAGNYPNIHSVLILRNNKLLYENYFPGNDEIRGTEFLDVIQHHRDTLHDIRSVTKSVVGTALLIALGQGKIKSVHQKVFDFFPEYAEYNTGMKRDLTINHLLNMTAGIEWDEVKSDTTNYERRMNRSADGIGFVLSLPLVDTPGKKYHYNGGCTQLIAAIVQKATGMPVDKFTDQFLFRPLSIVKYTWVKNRDGNPSAASGLRMRSRDMAKFGLLFMNNGKWYGKQIIPAHLAAQTLKNRVTTPFKYSGIPHVGYSNQFWIYTEILQGKKVTYVQCQGNGGQIILMDQKSKLCLIITAGNYNLPNLRKSSFDIYTDFIYPAVMRGSKNQKEK